MPLPCSPWLKFSQVLGRGRDAPVGPAGGWWHPKGHRGVGGGLREHTTPFLLSNLSVDLVKASASPAVRALGLEGSVGFWHLALGEAPGVNPALTGLGVTTQTPSETLVACASAKLDEVH